MTTLTRKICIILLLSMLLTSCAMASVKSVRGDYDNLPPMTPEETLNGQMCLGGIAVLFLICVVLSSGGDGCRQIIFSIIGLALVAFMALA